MEQFLKDLVSDQRKSENLFQLPSEMTQTLIEEFETLPLGPHSKNLKYMETSPLRHCYSFIIREVDFSFKMSEDNLPALPHFSALLCGLFSCDTDWLSRHLMRSYYTELPAEHDIYPHRDSLEYFQRVKRYHIYLSHSGGRKVIENHEPIDYRRGQVWSFDMTEVHSVENRSESSFKVLVFDILKGDLNDIRQSS